MEKIKSLNKVESYLFNARELLAISRQTSHQNFTNYFHRSVIILMKRKYQLKKQSKTKQKIYNILYSIMKFFKNLK